MDHVLIYRQPEVAADGPGRRLGWIGRANQLAHQRDCPRPFPDGRDDWPGMDVGEQAVVERLALVFGVERPGLRLVHVEPLFRDHPEARILQALQDAPGQAAPDRVRFEHDEGVRPDTSAEALSRLRPAFKTDGGSVTAGNSPGVNDGAAALVVMAAEKARELGVAPMARIELV